MKTTAKEIQKIISEPEISYPKLISKNISQYASKTEHTKHLDNAKFSVTAQDISKTPDARKASNTINNVKGKNDHHEPNSKDLQNLKGHKPNSGQERY